MPQFLERLTSLFRLRRNQKTEEAAVNEILQRNFRKLHTTDPETDGQWLRLERSIQQGESEAGPARSIPRLAFALVIASIAMMGVYAYFTFLQVADTFATGKGEQKRVVLHDGSQVTLNYATELVVAKLRDGRPRRVSLAGEAYFRVRPAETPFIISTQYGKVEVVGTEFNLRAREGILEVAVIGGMVNVSASKEGKDSTLVLTRHERALCPQNDFPRRIATIPAPEYPGWLHGKLFLESTSFSAACREIEMRFNVIIGIDDQRVRSDAITGILNAKTAEAAVTGLCELTGKRYAHDGEKYTIY